MTQTDAPTVDNGVNIEALRGARQALTDAPQAAHRRNAFGSISDCVTFIDFTRSAVHSASRC